MAETTTGRGNAAEIDLFISYAHQADDDRISRDAVATFVGRLHEEVEGDFRLRHGRDLRVFFDQDDIRDFDDWKVRCHRALRTSRFFIACLTRTYLRSDACKWEWQEWCKHEVAHGLVGQGAASLWFGSLDPDTTEDFRLFGTWTGGLLDRFHIDCRGWNVADPATFERDEYRAEFRRLIDHVAGRLRLASLDRQTRGNLGWPNTHFVGREEQKLQLQVGLSGSSIQRPTGLLGVGGIGKTALALAFADDEADAFPGGIWMLPCDGQTSLLFVVRNLVPDLGIHLSDEEKLNEALAVRRVLELLETRGNALFILDNVDYPALLAAAEMEPFKDATWLRFLFTSRLAYKDFDEADAEVHAIGVGKLSSAEALEVVRRYQPNEEFSSGESRAAVLEIARLLDGLALAVETAAVFLGQNDPRVAESGYAVDATGYLQLLRRDLGEGSAAGAMSQLREVAATLRPTLERLDTPARSVLHIASLLHADAIALPWLRAVATSFHAELAENGDAGKTDAWSALVQALVGMRLLGQTGEPRVLTMHRLLGLALNREIQEDRALVEERLLAHIDSRDEALEGMATWRDARWELEPFDSLATLWEERGHPRAAWFLNQAGRLWYGLGEWRRAEARFRRALAIDEHNYGRDNHRVARDLNNLGLLLRTTNHVTEAEPLLRRALAIDSSIRGEHHPAVALTLRNLAGVLQATKGHPEAESLVRQALAIDQHALGRDHPDVARDLIVLAESLKATSRFTESEPLLRRALEILQQSYRGPHPQVATALNNLAELLHTMSSFAEAETLYHRALTVTRACYGAEHPQVAQQLNNLALLLQATNRLADAEPLMRSALDIHESAFGPEHPMVAASLTVLAMALQETNRLSEAEKMLRRSKMILEQKGGDPSNYSAALSNLGVVLSQLGRSEEAELLMRRALEIDVTTYGQRHHLVAVRLNNLGEFLREQQRFTEAEPLLRRALEVDEIVHGKDHPHVATDLNNLALLLLASNAPPGAVESMLQRAVAIDEAVYGPHHPDVARDLTNLGALFLATGRLSDAVAAARRAAMIYLQATRRAGHEHPSLLLGLRNYAHAVHAYRGPRAASSAVAALGSDAGLAEEQFGKIVQRALRQ